MQNPSNTTKLVEIDVKLPIWDQFFCLAPLVLVGTREVDGTHDLAPKGTIKSKIP